MATAPFICNVEDSEESLKTAVSSHQLKHWVCSYNLLQVLVGVLVVLVLALTGGVIWMKLCQQNKVVPVLNNRDCPERLWTLSITGTKTNFTSPRTQKYVIFGQIFTKTIGNKCNNTFKLLAISKNETEIMKQNISVMFAKYDVELMEGVGLSITPNCKVEIDEENSKLFVYQQNP